MQFEMIIKATFELPHERDAMDDFIREVRKSKRSILNVERIGNIGIVRVRGELLEEHMARPMFFTKDIVGWRWM